MKHLRKIFEDNNLITDISQIMNEITDDGHVVIKDKRYNISDEDSKFLIRYVDKLPTPEHFKQKPNFLSEYITYHRYEVPFNSGGDGISRNREIEIDILFSITNAANRLRNEFGEDVKLRTTDYGQSMIFDIKENVSVKNIGSLLLSKLGLAMKSPGKTNSIEFRDYAIYLECDEGCLERINRIFNTNISMPGESRSIKLENENGESSDVILYFNRKGSLRLKAKNLLDSWGIYKILEPRYKTLYNK